MPVSDIVVDVSLLDTVLVIRNCHMDDSIFFVGGVVKLIGDRRGHL